MNILQLSGDFYPRTSGGAFTDWEFATTAVNRGHNVTVYTPQINGTNPSETNQGVNIRRPFRATPSNEHPNSWSGVIHRIIFVVVLTYHLFVAEDLSEFEVVYSTNYLMHPIAKLVSWYYGLNVVNFVGYTPSENPDLSRLDFRRIAEIGMFRWMMGEKVLCRTPQCRSKAESHGCDARIIHGILNKEDILQASSDDTYVVRQELGINDDETLIVAVGRLVRVKNIKGAVRTIAELPENYHLAIIGNGPQREAINNYIQYHDINSRVQLLGEQPHDETLRIITEADLLFLSSTVEAYPTVVFEALALGTPIAATPVGVLPEIQHDELYLSEMDSMPEQITAIPGNQITAPVIEDVLERYSMTRFSDTVLCALSEIN